MIYIYDIVVNFMDDKRVFEFFEWNSNDIVEHIKKIPLLKVSDNTLYDLVYSNIRVSDSLLELIKDKTYTYNEKIEYASLFTNGYKCYAIEFNSSGDVLYRSGLLIDEEEDVIICSKKQVNINFLYDVEDRGSNKYMTTREEDKKISIVKKDIENAYHDKNYYKIDYFYNEIYSDELTDIKEKYNKLIINLENININKLFNIINLEHKKKKAI